MILKVNKQLIKTILEDGAFSGAGGAGNVFNASGAGPQIAYGPKTDNIKSMTPKQVLVKNKDM